VSSQYTDAVRAMLEPELVCRCGEQNQPDPRRRPIRIHDIHGQTSCDTCGRCGPLEDFLRKETAR